MRCLQLLFFILIITPSFAQINQDWVNDDIDLIHSVKALNKQNPKDVDAFFIDKKHRNYKTNLGFGWSTFRWPVAKPGGYVSVYANLYYFHDSLVSYVLECHVPDDSLLWQKYMELYWDIFTPDSNAVFYYKYNEDRIRRPVGDVTMFLDTIAVTHALLEYMSPLSGTVYGCRGGISNSILKNRNLFNHLKCRLNYSQVILLMHSINPASRFTATEYYLRHKKRFPHNKEVDAWVEKLYAEVPNIDTMSGCSGYEEKSRELVYRYSRVKHDPK